MAELNEPTLDLSYGWDLGETEWKTGMDNNLIKLGATLFLSVLSKSLSAPPGGEAEGDKYIVASGATGTWTGYENQIAYFFGGVYRFYPAKIGWKAIIKDESNGTAMFDGAVWVGDLFLADGANIAFGTVTGTQIGNSILQKLAFFGSTPIVQPASVEQDVVTPGNSDGDIGGLTISATYTDTEIIALRDACEIVADDMRANNVLLNEIRASLVALGVIKGGA